MTDKRVHRKSVSKTALIVAHQYWPTPGPASLRLVELVRQLSGEFSITVITTRDGAAESRSLGPHGERIQRVPTQDATGQSLSRLWRLFLFMIGILAKQIATPRPAVIVSDPPPTAGVAALLTAKLRRADFVYYFCDSWAHVSNRGGLGRLLRPLLVFLENLCLRHADLVFAVEEKLVDVAISRRAKKVILVRNGADLPTIQRSMEGVGPRYFSGRPYFIYAGTHSSSHGARVFVEAAEILWEQGCEFGLLFAGTGTDSAWIDKRSAGNSHRLYRIEPVPIPVLVPLLRDSIASLVSWNVSADDDPHTPSKVYTSLGVGTNILYCGPTSPVQFLLDQELGTVVAFDCHAISDQMRRLLVAPRDDDAALRRVEYVRAHCDLSVNIKHALGGLSDVMSQGEGVRARKR